MGVLLMAACVTLALGEGLMCLRAGLRILKGRPVVIRAYRLFLPMMLLPLFNGALLIVLSVTNGFCVPLFCAGVVLVMIQVWLVARILISLTLLEVHNVRYESVRQAVLDTLDELAIEYDEHDLTIALRSLACKITLRGMYSDRTVLIRLAGRESKPVAAEVSSRLKSMPVSDSVGGYSSGAYLYLTAAVFMFALAGGAVAVWL